MAEFALRLWPELDLGRCELDAAHHLQKAGPAERKNYARSRLSKVDVVGLWRRWRASPMSKSVGRLAAATSFSLGSKSGAEETGGL